MRLRLERVSEIVMSACVCVCMCVQGMLVVEAVRAEAGFLVTSTHSS